MGLLQYLLKRPGIIQQEAKNWCEIPLLKANNYPHEGKLTVCDEGHTDWQQGSLIEYICC